MDGSPCSLRLRLFGGFELRADGDRDATPTGRKVRALLAYLALSPDTRSPREKLMALLWGDRAEEQARASLRQALTDLRQALGEASPLQTEQDTVILDTTAIAVDAIEFPRLVKAGKLNEAAALYRGPLLDGHGVRDGAFEDWLLVERTRFHDLAMDVLHRVAASQTGEAAIDTAQRLLRLDAAREATHRLLMRLYAGAGQRAQALRQYQLCRDALWRDLQTTPDSETERLHREVLDESLPIRPTEADAAKPGLATPRESKPSIAVLPFTNMSGDPEQEYFSDGITEDIITDLSRVSALFLVARHTSFMFKGKSVEVVDAARQLNVDYILEGSVRKAGNRVRITAQLVDGATAVHVWAERYDRELVDIFAVQDEIAKSIVAALKVRLLPKELESIVDRSTSSADAYECYLQGRADFIESWASRSTMRAARKLFSKAAEIDPGYAKAYAGIAGCDAFLWVTGDHDISYEHIRANSDKALQLAADLPEGHAFRGVALYATGNDKEACAALARAIELDPVLFGAHFFYGMVSRNLGHWNTAASAFQRAAALRSDDFASLPLLADVYELQGRREEAKAAARRGMIRIESILSHRPDRAEVLAFGAISAVYVEEHALAEERAQRAVQLEPDNYSVRYNAACAYAVMGKTDIAMEQLKYVYSKLPRAVQVLRGFISVDPQLNSLRERADFQELLKQVGGVAPSHR